jgi:WhiB family redox-sensing transcriptional regulator
VSDHLLHIPYPKRVMGDWHERGLCLELCRRGEAHHDWWFSERGETREVRQAKEICAACVVRPQCLEWATENKEQGIWAGLSVESRRRLRDKRRRMEKKSA